METEVIITEMYRGVKGEFRDGAIAYLTLAGSSCTCPHVPGTLCRHMHALLPAYQQRKWRLAEENRGRWSAELYAQIGISPRIFFPPEIDWNQYPDEDMVYVRNVQRGHLFIFRDGAHLWVGKDHPEGRTKCSLCGTRDCRHYEMIIDEVFNLTGEKRQEVA